jgi:hypothetical protein
MVKEAESRGKLSYIPVLSQECGMSYAEIVCVRVCAVYFMEMSVYTAPDDRMTDE